MLRDFLVLTIILVGFFSCWRGPFYALLFYLWLGYFRPEQWLWNDWVSAGHLSLIVGVIIVIQTLLSPPKIKFRGAGGLLLLLFFQSLISTMFSQDWDWSWGWWLDFSKVLLIGYLITAHVTDTRRLRIVFLVLALSLGFEAAKQGWVNLIRHPGAANMNSHPVLGDNNGVAVGLLMLVPVLGALARSANSLGERWLHRFIALGVLMRGISTYSRGGFLAAGALGLAYVAQSKRRITTLVVTAVLATTVLSVMPASFWDRMRTITASDEERDSSAQSRLYFWQVAVRMMMDHPFTGIGFNAYTRMYDAYDTSDRVYGRLRAVHSSWFGALSEMGVPGLLLVLALLANAVQNCRRVRQRPAHEGQYKTRSEFATGLLTSFFVFAVGGSFINAHYNELFWHLVCLATAVRYAEPAEVQAPSPVVGAVVGQHAILST